MLISNIFSNYFRTIDKKIFSIQKPMNKINVFRNNDEDFILTEILFLIIFAVFIN